MPTLPCTRVRPCLDVGTESSTTCTTPRRSASSGDRERAFTLVELLVAMVLAVLALGLFIAGVIQALGDGTSARNGAMSDAAISRTLDSIDDDVARAYAPDRAAAKLRDPFELEDALMRNATPHSSDPADAGAPLQQFDDIVTATPTRLVARVDADPTRAGVECVTWDAGTGSGGAFVVERTVAASCGGAVIGRERFLTVQATALGRHVDTTPFSYKLVCDRTRCPGAPGGASPCEPWVVERAVRSNQLRWIVEVTTSLTQIHGDRGGARAVGSSASTIRARDTSEYRAGLGC